MSHLSLVAQIWRLSLALSLGVLTLYGCATSSGRPTAANAQKDASQSAIQTAEALLQSEEAFYTAQSNRDGNQMVDAALSREKILPLAMASENIRNAIAATTRRMLEQARLYAKDDARLTERIDAGLTRHKQRSTSGLFGSLGKMKSGLDDYVRTLDVEAHSTVSVDLDLASDTSVGTTVYVQHKPNEPIILSVVKRDGKAVCTQRNPRGYLVCRYKQMASEQLTAIVANQGPSPTRVLFIRSQ